MDITLELIERFHEKWILDPETGCWEWTAAKMGRGYGFIKVPGTRTQVGAHRLSYLIHEGIIPDGMSVCHVCDNPGCVRPTHLFLGSTKDNLQDMKQKGRHLYGDRNSVSKLDDDKVRRIHQLSSKGVSQGRIGKLFGISQGTVFKILHGERWEHIYREIQAGQK
jgi:hypothetical protein